MTRTPHETKTTTHQPGRTEVTRERAKHETAAKDGAPLSMEELEKVAGGVSRTGTSTTTAKGTPDDSI